MGALEKNFSEIDCSCTCYKTQETQNNKGNKSVNLSEEKINKNVKKQQLHVPTIKRLQYTNIDQ